jgi:hypothetical protein
LISSFRVLSNNNSMFFWFGAEASFTGSISWKICVGSEPINR